VPDFLTDLQIERLVSEPKPLPADWRRRLAPRPKSGHTEAELQVRAASGGLFRLVLRRSLHNPLDFSVILAFVDPESGRNFRLRRYNGKSHEHTNPMENERFYDFHVHRATERYQRSGNREDTFAVVATAFATMEQALELVIAECAFAEPVDPQARLP
jgi:hypothetical protein